MVLSTTVQAPKGISEEQGYQQTAGSGGQRVPPAAQTEFPDLAHQQIPDPQLKDPQSTLTHGGDCP
jgi:hypothetical protein